MAGLVTLDELGMMTAKSIGIQSHMHRTKVSRWQCLSGPSWYCGGSIVRSCVRHSCRLLRPAAKFIELAPCALDGRRLVEPLDAADRAALNSVQKTRIERSAQLSAELANDSRPG